MAKIALNYRGCVENVYDLPLVGNAIGNFFIIKSSGFQYYWSIVAPNGNINDWKVLNVLEDIPPSVP